MKIETMTIQIKCDYSLMDIVKLWLIGLTIKREKYSMYEVMAMRGRVRS